MLLAIAIQNFRSFRDESLLDLQKRSFTTNLPSDGDWTAVTERLAIVFGPNASGKSNFLRAINNLARAIALSVPDPNVTRELRDPHALSSTTPTSFSIDFVADQVRFRWTLDLDDRGVVSESLRANETGHWRKVFDRDRNTASFGPQSNVPKAARENISEFLTDWVLLFSAWGRIRTRGTYYSAVEWWLNKVSVHLPLEPTGTVRHDALRKLAKHPSWIRVIPDVLRIADVGVTDVRFDERKAEFPEEMKWKLQRIREIMESDSEADNLESPGEATEEEMEFLESQLLFTHSGDGSESFELEEKDESLGTRAWYDIAISAVIALATGQTLIVDELDSSLHPSLVLHLVSLFNSNDTNPSGAQLICTSHDVTLLRNNESAPLTPSSFWFVEKTSSVSELYSLDEFPVRKAHNFEKRYLMGIYGAIPIIGNDIDKHIGNLNREVLQSSERTT